MTEPSRKARLTVAFAITGFVLSVAAAIAIHRGESPWFELGGAIVIGFTIWQTYQKLTSKTAVTTFWDGHIRYFGLASVLLLAAPLWIGGRLSRQEPIELLDWLSVPISFIGGLMLYAEGRDFQMWREEEKRAKRQSGDEPGTVE